MKTLQLLLVALLIWLQYSLWLGKHGIIALISLDSNIVNQKKNETLSQRNAKLFAEVSDLYDGKEAAIEERSRNELDMIKPGETFYRLVPIK
ncbi:cell division protein FtsB [Candidatus Palibaumannia cicadellinicola]|uniref:cell division protein FtsB n=1 Tax=Candidatus Palibaumannia cicadellinicola TaxID=186490 RepID=UPI00069F03E9|nr:cell division protein FtsB [Candidatus Baumannia cicadellinicola]